MQALAVIGRLVVIAACLGSGAGVQAQVARSGGSSQAVQQVQQLAQERTALQGENARLRKDLDTALADLKRLRGEHDALKSRAGGAESEATRLRSANEATERAAASARAKLEELVGRFREMAQTLRETEADRAQLHQKLDERSRAYDQCAMANVELHDLAVDMLVRYERYSAGRADPFTGIARVRAENLVDEYRQRADELKIASPSDKPPGR